MTTASHLPIRLTSEVIAVSADNYYNYAQQAVLFPHEPIRRELERGQKALESIDVAAHPWKAQYVHVWLVELLIPMILDHHDSEEKHMGPFYKQRGAQIPDSVGGAHAKLTVELEKIGTLAETFAQSPTAENLASLKACFESMSVMMGAHFAEEERFWPAAIEQVGEEDYQVFHKEMHTDMRNQPSGHMFLMSALDSMGYEFDGFPHVEGDSRWCGDQLLEDLIINKIPYFVRSWVFSPINRKYQYYKKLVNWVVVGTEDNIPLKYEEASKCIVC